MSERKYTQGPWSVTADGLNVKNTHLDTMICIDPREIEYVVEAMANANLIAAAPELLEALEGLRSCISETRGSSAHYALERADATIAKAKGDHQRPK